MADSINGLNIPSIQNNKPVNFQQTVVTTPMQGIPVDQEKLKQAATDNYISNRVKASEGDNPLAKLGIGTAIWYGIAQLMDKINPKMGGNFEKSLGGKVASVGDSFSATWLGKKIDGFIDWFDTRTTKWAEQSKIINSLKYHSTSPEWKFAKTPAKGLYGFWSVDADQVLQEYLKPIGTNAQKLEQYAISQKDIDEFVKTLKGKTPDVKKLMIQEKELSALGVDAKVIERINGFADRAAKSALSGAEGTPQYAELLKQTQNSKRLQMLQKYAEKLKCKDFGEFKSVAEFRKFESIDNPDKAVKIWTNLAEKHPDWKVSIWRNKTKGAFSKLRTHLFGRTVSFTEYRNKGLIAAGKGGASRLGRFMSKAMGWIMEGSTNRFGGGKLVVALQAFIFAEMVMATIKAPWGEKFKTGVERVVNDFTYFVGATLGIVGMHKIGGFKYLGLKDAAAIEKYRMEEKALNAKNDAGLFASKKDWKQAVKNLNQKYLGKENIKNPFARLLQKIGEIINIGNERIKPYKSTAKWNLNWLRKIKNGNLIGVPLRIWLVMGVVVPFLVKAATKGCHAIFGRPTHSVLDEDEEEKEKDVAPASQQAQPTVQQSGAATAVAASAAAQQRSPQDYKSDTNLIKQAMSGKPAFQGALNSPNDHPTVQDYKTTYPDTNYVKMTLNGQYPPEGGVAQQELNNGGQRYVPNPNSNVGQNSTVVNNTTTTIVDGNGQTQATPEPYRTYIPSPDSKVKNNVDLTAAEKALADADNAEKFINDTLSQMK
ncbi:hypothetical protein IKR55_00900 [bacterium]|nr:hypothetical protein [bacterium]